MPAQVQPLQPEDRPHQEVLIDTARAMGNVLRERQIHGNLTCSLASETIAECKQAGFYKILQPAALGGWELPAASLFKLEMTLAETDVSAGWVIANMGVAAFHVALFDPRAQADIWGEMPNAIISSANMPGGKLISETDGTYSLSGNWRFSSGIDHADWVILGAFDEGDGTPVAGGCLVPRQDITIVSDWDVVGLRGTGSHAIQVTNAKVPRYRFLPHMARFDGSAPGLSANAGALYRLPLPQLLFRAISSASIGGLQGMLDCFITSNSGRTSMMAQKIAQDPHIQSLCAEISADLEAFRSGLDHQFDVMVSKGCKGDPADLDQRRKWRLEVTRIPQRCFLHGAKLHRAAGAAALYRNNPILLYFNDLLAARQHAALQYEVHARNDGAVLFGEEREDILL